MIDIVVDSGPLIALFDGSDAHHARTLAFRKGLEGRLVSNLPVVTEVVHLPDFAPQAQRDFLAWAERALSLDIDRALGLPRRARPAGGLQDLLPAAYDDRVAALHPDAILDDSENACALLGLTEGSVCISCWGCPSH